MSGRGDGAALRDRLGAWSVMAVAAVVALQPFQTDPAEAQVPPDAHWRTVESAHLRVTFAADDPRLEPLARHAAARGEVAWALLEEAVGRAPEGKVDIVLTDAVDYTNGSATPYPTNRIVLHARPPVDDLALGHTADWIELVVVHELAHVFHLDRTGPLGEVARAVFGRLPYTWPLFPAAGSPRWATEGLAVALESDATGLGRLHGSWHETVVRTAVLEGGGLPGLDRVSAAWAVWPGGETPYIYGSLFLNFLRAREGPAYLASLVDATADAPLPPELTMDRIGRRAGSTSFSAGWRAWGNALAARYGALRDSLEARGLTPGERLTEHGRWALFPRFSPDGERLAYLADDGRSVTVTRVVDAATGARVWEERRSGQGGAAWLPGSGLLTAQLEFADPYRIYADLYRLAPDGTTRLTAGARLQDPDVTRDGRVVAVRQGGGTTHLAVGALHTPDALTPLTPPRPDVHWAQPRWSPDGTAVAAVRWHTGGARALVVVGADGRERVLLEEADALVAAPTWSPDGAWVLFTSDRTGITNVYAVAADGSGPLHQVTEVLGGAFQPDVAPDGRWLVWADYHADGFHLVRLPFDPGAWRVPGPAAPTRGTAALPNVAAVADTTTGPVRDYSALAAALPAFWSPVVVDEGRAGTFLGAGLAGVDLVGRHRWSAWAALNPADGLWEGAAAWTWAGLGRPLLGLSAFREWDWAGQAVLPDDTRREVLSREDGAALTATLPWPRWRRSLSLGGGLEMTRRHRVLQNAGVNQLRDADDRLLGALLRAGYADDQRHALGISRQGGVALGGQLRRRWDADHGDERADGYDEALGSAAAYLALGRVGFADAVLALRASGLWRDGPGARPSGVGGASGDVALGLGGIAQGGSRLLPVRGFEEGDRGGTRAWTASAEVRVPVALVGRGAGLLPVFLDRISAAAFADAGGAGCPAGFTPCGVAGTLLSAGAELGLDLVLGFRSPLLLRLGVAAPLHGPRRGAVFHLRVGPSF